MAILPQKLVSLIVDELEDDTEMLNICALINHAFYARAREYIFYAIKILGRSTHGFQEKRCRELHELLLHQPTLPSCIHSLILVDNSACLDGDTFQDGDLGGWLTSSNLGLATIIASLTSLETISIRCNSGFLNWNWLSKDLQLALNEAFLRPSISDLRLENIVNFKIESLAEYSHLKHLRLHHVRSDNSTRTAAGSSSMVTPEIHPTIELDHPDIADCGVALDTLFSRPDHPSHHFDIVHIRRLSVDLSDFSHDMVSPWSKLLSLCANTVEEYHVTHRALESIEIPSSIFAFSQFPRLRTAKITLFPEYWQYPEHDKLFPALRSGLDEFKDTSPQIEEFCVETNLQWDRPLIVYLRVLAWLSRNAFWSDLDSTLSHSGFKNLAVVRVAFNMSTNSYDGVVFLKDVRVRMLRLYNGTKLKLSCTMNSGDIGKVTL